MGMEKYGKFDFSRWKCKYLAQNQPKSMMAQWLCWGRVRLFRFQFHALMVRGLLSTGCTLNFLRKVLKLKSEKTKLNLSVCHHRLWPVLGQTFTFQGKKSNLPYFPISSAQCSRCQLGCSGSQNLPGSNYRRIICSCSYYMEHAKILLYQLLEQIILHKSIVQKPQYALGG